MTIIWTDVPDVRLASGKPVRASDVRFIRDDITALAQGLAGAPAILRTAIAASGSGLDDAWDDGTSLTGDGFYEPETIEWTAPRTLPSILVARVNGDVTVSAALTVPPPSVAERVTGVARMRATLCANGEDATGTSGGGAGAGAGAGGHGGGTGHGAGGTGDGTSYHTFLAMNPQLGGNSGNSTVSGSPIATPRLGGGALILIIDGDLDMTGGTINVNGAAGDVAGEISGAGGGTLIIICTGDIKAGAYNAKGGDGDTATGAGGGGGKITLVASSFSGSRSHSVAGGGTDGGATSTSGSAGSYEEITLTTGQIRALLFRSY